MSHTSRTSYTTQSCDDTKTIHGSEQVSTKGLSLLAYVPLYSNPDYIIWSRGGSTTC